jgi:hypothetical protein
VKNKKKNIKLNELFRQKLENAEVIPDAAVKSMLMRKVARKEFLRFNPARLNIFYLSGILITGITAAVLLITAPQSSIDKKTITPVNAAKTDSGKYIDISTVQPISRKPQQKTEISGKPDLRKNSLSLTENIVSSEVNKSRSDSTLFPVIINRSLSKNSLVSDANADIRKLQPGLKSDAFLIDPSTYEGCAPLKLRFHNLSNSFDSCRWTFGDGGYSVDKDPEWIFDIEGEYKVVLKVFLKDGSASSSVAKVTVHPRPQAHFEISPPKAILPNDEIHFMNYSTNAIQFIWDFGDGSNSEFFEPNHTYTKFSNYDVRLVAISDWGCSDTLVVYNAFSGSEFYIDFPNAFIPNAQGPTGGYYSSKSDEGAQVFHPSFSGVSEYHLKIFSKLGIPIFESSDLNLGWDGYNKGQLCEPGVYIWKVRGKYRNGEPFIKMGDVTLLKN